MATTTQGSDFDRFRRWGKKFLADWKAGAGNGNGRPAPGLWGMRTKIIILLSAAAVALLTALTAVPASAITTARGVPCDPGGCLFKQSDTGTIGHTICAFGYCVPEGFIKVTEYSTDPAGHYPVEVTGTFFGVTALSGVCGFWMDFDSWRTGSETSSNLQWHNQGAEPIGNGQTGAVCDAEYSRTWDGTDGQPLPGFLSQGNLCATLWTAADGGASKLGHVCVDIGSDAAP